MLCRERSVYAHEFSGERFDTGHVVGYLEATVDFALRDPELREEFIQILKEKKNKYGVTL
jgi:UTP--glucose-1-phosphate uridylyltransferase